MLNCPISLSHSLIFPNYESKGSYVTSSCFAVALNKEIEPVNNHLSFRAK